jgi:hemoglobin/transferrin/lactoferrin receptor protein
MPAWETYNIRANWQAHRNFNFSFAVENLLDLHYRTFSSGVSAPGRNLIASARISF